MKKKLFGQNIPANCIYCEFYNLENELAYCQKGKQMKNDKCRHFKYDPLMRIPRVTAYQSNYSIEDFKL